MALARNSTTYLRSAMESRKLQITIVSAENIGQAGGYLWPVRVYAVVSLNGRLMWKTTVDWVGGRNPIWNAVFNFIIHESAVRQRGSDVVVKLYHRRFLQWDRFVGETKISVSSLFQLGIAAAVSYPVEGTESGMLNISYKFEVKVAPRRSSSLLTPRQSSSELTPRQSSSELTPKRYSSIQASSSSLTPKRYGIHASSSSLTPKPFNWPSFQTTAKNRQLGLHGYMRKALDLEQTVGQYMSQVDRTGKEKVRINDEAMSQELVKMGLRNKRYLKDFVMFCSVFSLDYEFTKDVLVWQWIAGRFIELREVEETEKVCMEHFNTLLGMDYIRPSGYDHVLDQAKYKIGAKMITFIQDQPLEPKFGKYLDSIHSHHDPTKVELLSLSFKKIDSAVLKQYSCLHTLVIHDCYEVDHLPSDLFSELKSLKILNLSRTNIVELPSSVENLKELRFLDMSNTPLVWLPETICCFTHLQTLKLDGCVQLEGLPAGTSNLINLRHLILDVVRQLEAMPVTIGKLSNLLTLSAFLVSKEDGFSVIELKNMNKLRGTFRLLNLENVRTKEETSEACLYKKVELRKIEFQWSDLQDEKIPKEEEILESLQPPLGIQELKILFYSGGVLPSWICDPSFKELVTIFLYKCRHCISLPSLGELPSLKHLSIIENNEVVKIDNAFCRKQRNQYDAAFPKLEKLTFESMSILELWTDFEMGDFPSLRHLIIEYCPKLVGLHYLWFLESLSHLEIRYCPELLLLPYDTIPLSLQSLMIKESPRMKEWCCEEDWYSIAHVPTVYFDHQKFLPEMCCGNGRTGGRSFAGIGNGICSWRGRRWNWRERWNLWEKWGLNP